jgi:hypothetical protein
VPPPPTARPANDGRRSQAAPDAKPAAPAAEPAAARGEPAAPIAAPARPAPSGSESAARWPEFLEFIQERKLSVYFSICHAELVELGAGRIVLGVAGDTFRKELTSPPTLGEIERLAGEFFGRPMHLEVGGAERRPVAAPKQDTSPREVLDDPAVRRATQFFGAEVSELRPRRSGE